MDNNQGGLQALAEQLCRIEHKLDLVLRSQAENLPTASIIPMGSPEHICPVCYSSPAHRVDVLNGHVVRTCGCSTGQVPYNLGLAPTITSIQGNNNNGGSE